MPPATSTLPFLADLLLAFEHAFQHHTESRPRANGGVTLSLTGLELAVRSVTVIKKPLERVLPKKLAEVAAYGLATALTDPSPSATQLRLELIAALANIEASAKKNLTERISTSEDDPLLTTAEAAALLAMSRPHISMLCDQGKLGEVSRSEGGHRRIKQSAVVAYKQAQAEGLSQ